MSTSKEKSRGNLGLIASVALHVLFFAGCLMLDTSNLSSSDDTSKEVTEINPVKNSTAMAQIKS